MDTLLNGHTVETIEAKDFNFQKPVIHYFILLAAVHSVKKNDQINKQW
jgi:hypothetical protein